MITINPWQLGPACHRADVSAAKFQQRHHTVADFGGAPRGCAGAEWWIGRAHTTRIPVEFHFDQDVKGRGLRHPRLASVFFFNAVRGGQLAVTDQVPGGREATRLETVAPKRNRYALFRGNLLHGVLDARGRTPGRRVPGPPGRMRITLVVNYWDLRPSGVRTWSESGLYRLLRPRAGRY